MACGRLPRLFDPDTAGYPFVVVPEMSQHSSHVTDATYKVLQVVTGVVGGMAASAIFTRLWARFDHSEHEPPEAHDLTQSTSKVLVAAAAQGAIFALVRAIINRASAHGYQRVVGGTPPA